MTVKSPSYNRLEDGHSSSTDDSYSDTDSDSDGDNHLDDDDNDSDNSDSDSHRGRELNTSENVIVLFRLQNLRAVSICNFLFAVLALAYLGVNLVMLVCNYMLTDGCFEDAKPPHHRGGTALSASSSSASVFDAQCGSPVSVYTFHMIEFSSTFLFSVLQACALLLSSPKGMRNAYELSPGRLRLVLFFSVVVSFVPAMLIWLNIEAFETVAHEIEYSVRFRLNSTPEVDQS